MLQPGGERVEVVHAHEQAVSPPILEDVLLREVADAAVERERGGPGVAPPQFLLDEFVEKVELGLDGVAPGALPHPLDEVKNVGGRVEVRDRPGVEGGGKTESAFHPSLQHGPFRGAGVLHPAPQEPKIAVPQGPASEGGGLLPPFPHLEDERHVLPESPRPRLGIIEAVESREQGAVRAADALDLDRQGIPIEEVRRDHPRRVVASIHRKGIGAHPPIIPPGREAT